MISPSLFLDQNLKPIKGGLSNRIFLAPPNRLVRFKMPSDPHFYDPKSEETIFKASEGNLFPHLYVFEPNGDYIAEYLAGHHPFLGPDTDAATLYDLGKRIKELHELKPSKDYGSFRPLDRLEYYKNAAKGKYIDEKAMQKAIDDYKEAEKAHAPCPSHNDMVRGNVLEDEKGNIKFIDLEFSGACTPFFDVGSVLSENGINGEEKARALLEGTLGTATENDVVNLKKVIHFQDALWYYWALYRYQLDGLPIFLQIAEEKLKAFESLRF